MKSNNQKRTQALALRKKGASYGTIGAILGVSKSTLSYWLKDVPLPERYRRKLYTARLRNMVLGPRSIHERRKKSVERIIAAAREETSGPLSADAHRLIGVALYWAEGSKGGALAFTNSDPLMVLFFVKWVSNFFNIAPSELKAWLNLYPQQDETELKRFWSSLSGIPVSRFGKSFIKPISKGVKKNNLYYGTIRVRVPKSTDLQHRVSGWLQGALSELRANCDTVQERWGKLRHVEKPLNLQ